MNSNIMRKKWQLKQQNFEGHPDFQGALGLAKGITVAVKMATFSHSAILLPFFYSSAAHVHLRVPGKPNMLPHTS